MRFTITGKVLLGFLLLAAALSTALFFTYRNLDHVTDSVSVVGEPSRKFQEWKSAVQELNNASAHADNWKVNHKRQELEMIDSSRSIIFRALTTLRVLNYHENAAAAAMSDSLRYLTNTWFENLGNRIALEDSLSPGQLVVDNILKEMAERETDAVPDSALNALPAAPREVKDSSTIVVKEDHFWQRIFRKHKTPQAESDTVTAQAQLSPDTTLKRLPKVKVVETARIREAIRTGQETEQSQREQRLLEEMTLLRNEHTINERISRLTDRYEKIIAAETEQLLLSATKASVAGTRSVMLWMSAIALCFVIVFVLAIQRDVIRDRKLKIHLEQARRSAENLAKAKEEFLANMSHEIRTPLNIISGFTSQLLQSPLEEKQRMQAEGVHRSSEHLLSLVNDILDYSKMQSGKMEIEQIGFRLSDLAHDLDAAFGAVAKQKGLGFSVTVSEQLPKILIGDPVRIRQILFNLISNAIKFTAKGSVHVVIAGDSYGQLEISVTDTGIGISKEKIKSIFEAFTQADSSISRRFGGTGLGLSITSLLIEKMGGTIDVSSEPGKGSTFKVMFPLLPGATSDLPAGVQEQPATFSLKGKTILICDDEPMNRILAAHILEGKGATVLEAGSGLETLEILVQQPADLILMDIQMPDLNGNETTRRIRALQDKKIASVPVIAVTGKANDGEREKCLQSGMNGYLIKPYKEQQLLQEISQALSAQ